MFSFKTYTQKEQDVIDAKNKEIKESTEAAAQTLKDCITSDTFMKYREELKTSDKALIGIGIGILREVKDNNKRVALYDQLFVRADVLSLLLKSLEKDNV